MTCSHWKASTGVMRCHVTTMSISAVLTRNVSAFLPRGVPIRGDMADELPFFLSVLLTEVTFNIHSLAVASKS